MEKITYVFQPSTAASLLFDAWWRSLVQTSTSQGAVEQLHSTWHRRTAICVWRGIRTWLKSPAQTLTKESITEQHHYTSQPRRIILLWCGASLGKELGANVNQGKHDGATPLMIAATTKNENVVAFLIKYMYGANPKLSGLRFGTAADISKNSGARIRQRRADAVPRVVQNILRALLKSG